MKKYIVLWSKNALNNLHQAYLHKIKYKSNRAKLRQHAKNIVKYSRTSFDYFPNMYTSVAHCFNLRINHNFRIAPLNNYLAVYQVNEQKSMVIIIMLKNHKQDIKSDFKKWFLNHYKN